jgi:hypothetical protein
VQTFLAVEEFVEPGERGRRGIVVGFEFVASGLAVYLTAEGVLGALDQVEEDCVFETAIFWLKM